MGTAAAVYAHIPDPIDFRAHIRAIGATMPLPDDDPGADRVAPAPLLSLSVLAAASGAVKWAVKGVLPAESIGILFGGSGTFKSFIALDLCCHVAHGLQWLGRRTTKGVAIYIAAEGGAGLWRRVDAWHRARRLNTAGCQLYVVPVALDLGQDCSRVVEAASALGITPTLVVVDTLSQTYAGEENSANEVAAYLREVGLKFRQVWQCAVAIVHHSGHGATERPRGSSAIRANVDWMFGVFRQGEDSMLATVECMKQKDGEKVDDITFRLDLVGLGQDDDGDDVSSLVASHVRTPQEMSDAVRDQAAHGRKGYHATLIELAKEGQKERDLRTAFYESCEGLGSLDSKSKAFRRALRWACDAGLLGVVNGEVRIFRRI